MGNDVTVGVGQTKCELGNVGENLRHCIDMLDRAAE